MKKFISLKIIMAALLVIICLQLPKTSSAQVGVSFQVFYDDLSPYGQWVNDPYYGYVWQPSLGGDFRPYCSGGHWEMTTYGNMWVSDYPWGWAPFHYGRWALDDSYGWVWIPGTTWGPAWVCWRQGGGYYGWAPLGPGVYADIRTYQAPDAWWYFCPQEHFLEPRYNDYYYGPRATTIVHNTVIINNTYVNRNVTYYSGPRRAEVEQVRKQPVPVYAVNRNGARGAEKVNGNSINVYGPRVSRTSNTAAAPAPPKVVNSAHPINNSSFIKENKNVKLPPPRPAGNANGGRAATAPGSGRTPANRPAQASPRQQAPANSGRTNVAPRTNKTNTTPANRPQAQPRQASPAQRPNAAPRQNQNIAKPAPQQKAAPRPNQNMNRPAPQQNAAPRQNMNRPAPQQNRAPQNNPAPRPQAQPQMNRPAPQQNRPPQNNPAPRPQAQPQMNRPAPQENRPPQNNPAPRPQAEPQNHPQPQMERPKDGPKWRQ